MKNSGIEWIGEIPDDWNITTIKYACVFSPKCSKIVGLGIENEITYTPMEYIKNGYYIQNTKIIADIPSSLTMYEEGDIVMAKVTPCFENGNIARMDNLVNGVGVGSSELYVFRTKKYNRDYLFYLLQNYIFKDCAASTMIGTGGLKRVSSHFIKNSKQPFPPLSEQKAIAEFLDKKCGEVDALIADIQQEIETLEQYKRSVITESVTKGLDSSVPMKDSGIQWIGNMPANWKCIRGKYILKYLQKPVKKDDGVITCFRDGEVTLRSNRREDGFAMADKEIGYQGVDIGDLVVHGMDGFAGAIGISDSQGKASPVLNVLGTKQNKRYIMYYLRSMAYSDVFMALSTGIRVRSCDLRWNKLAELWYPIPPLKEQEKIVTYIDETIQKANEIIADKQLQIETLESYKKSLIYEYVTGKKEIIAQ